MTLGISIGQGEWIIILIVLLLIFGSTQLPKLARSLGSAQKEFRKGIQEAEEDSTDSAQETDNAQETSASSHNGSNKNGSNKNGSGKKDSGKNKT